MKIDLQELVGRVPLVEDLARAQEVFWENPKKKAFGDLTPEDLPVSMEDIKEAEARLERFRPFIARVFPETREAGGLIESPLARIDDMAGLLRDKNDFEGDLYLKLDSHLPVAGSVKARGGIYEVLKLTEDLAKQAGLLDGGDYEALAGDRARDFFKDYTIQVGSTGNLGLSIGISSAQIGYKVIVHMSQDAKEWKKDLLRSYGVQVIEYESDYSLAVKEGRAQSEADPKSHFVDDENSLDLFMGYAVAALRLRSQLKEAGIEVTEDSPLNVYLPCGVGGAPGGVAYGLKLIFKDGVRLYFVEPTQAPCMVLGMATGLHNKIAVTDIGLDGKTQADGLAVGRPSGFVGRVMDPLLDGVYTIKDQALNPLVQELYKREDLFIEPSAAAAFQGLILPGGSKKGTHIAWATGGRLVPQEVRDDLLDE